MTIQYAGKTDEKTAQAMGYALSISRKHVIEIGNYIRGLPIAKARRILQETMEKKKPIPFKRFHGDVGHRAGAMAAGRYPIKASEQVLKLMNSAAANAKQKGLEESALIIDHFSAHKGPSQWRHGRQRRRRAKRTHLMIILREKEKKKKKEAQEKELQKEEKKEVPPAIKSTQPLQQIQKKEEKSSQPKKETQQQKPQSHTSPNIQEEKKS